MLFCFGCRKTDKNITINIYENSVKEEINEEINDNISSVEDMSNIEQAKDWYDKNKDDVKDINKEIIESDKEAITNIIDDTKSWYDENKDELKETSKEIYNNDKETLIDLYNKIKNNV